MKVKFIPNILKSDGRVCVEVPYDPNKTVRDYLEESGFSYEHRTVVVSGKVCEDLDSTTLRDFDQIIISHDVREPATLITVLKIVLLLVAIAAAVVSIVAAARKPRRPSFNTRNSFGVDEGSPTYGWDGIQLRQDVGVPIGVIYGKHRVGGNIVNQFIHSDGDKNYLNMLIGLGNGEIESISDILVNDNPIENFDSVEIEKRYGTNAQSVVPYFDELHNLATVDANLNEQNDTHVYTTVDTDVEGFVVHVQLPQGLYSSNQETGDTETTSVSIKIEYAVAGSGSWTEDGTYNISGKHRSIVRRTFEVKDLAAGQYDIRVTRTTAGSTFYITSDLSWKYLDEIRNESLSYPNTALLGLRLLATDQLSGASPNVTSLIKGTKVRVPDIRDGANDPVNWENYYWKPADSTWRLISDNTILSWDGTTYVDAYSANPVWCVRDLLTNTLYGLGNYISADSIDDDMYLEMAKYCDELVPDGSGGNEKRFELDIVIDSPTESLDVLQQIATSFRGMFFVSEGHINLRIDKPEAPVQLFTMGNIVEDSFSQNMKSRKEYVNMMEIQFLDKSKNYEQDTVADIDETALANGENIRKQEMRIFCTRMTQALREARFYRAKSQNENRTIQFKAGIDALALQAGDVFSLAHDVPQWGVVSGRVQTGATTVSVPLGEDITLVSGTTYKIMVQHDDDTIEERTVSNTPGTYSTLTVSSAFSKAPVAWESKFSVGEENIVTKPFRCVSISMASNHEAEITAIEYVEELYDDTAIVVPDTNYSTLTTGIPNARDLLITEEAITKKDGTVENRLHAWWDYADDTEYKNKVRGYELYLSDDSQATWTLVGYTEGRDYVISHNVDADKTYYVAVSSVTADGMKKPVSSSPVDSIVTTGKTDTPDVVDSLSASLYNGILRLAWNPNTEADLLGYEVRLADANWGTDNANLVFRGLQTELSLEVQSRNPGTYYIKAFNTSNVYSPTAQSVTPTNSAPSAIVNVDSDIFFNSAKLYWDNSGDTDVKKYQVYKSETDAWGGEEELYAEVQGRSLALEGKTPYQGVVTEKTSDTVFKIEVLEGLADDYFNKDKLLWTSGDNQAEFQYVADFDGTTGQITLNSTPNNTVQVGDKIHITDVAYFKVRAVDHFGEGAFSAAHRVDYQAFAEDMLPDTVVTARKIYVENLSALSANMGSLTAGSLTGGTIQTGNGGQRLVFNNAGIHGYDSCCNERLFIDLEGNIKATSLCMVDPNCSDAYSYFSEGEMYFRDAQGHETPYVKRVDFGTITNGAEVCLQFWRESPKVMISANELTSYNANYPASDQKWCIYHDGIEYYCNCADDWGFKFTAHADLVKGAGTYSECVHDVDFNCSVCTNSDACCTRIRLKLQLWANDDCVGATYCNGCLSYKIQYKCFCDASWCECSYTYCHNDSTIDCLKKDYDVCHNIYFGGCNGCYEVRVCQDSLVWCTTSLPVVSLTTCCLTYTGSTQSGSCALCCVATQQTPGVLSFSGGNSSTASFAGAKPASDNIQCMLFCHCSVTKTHANNQDLYQNAYWSATITSTSTSKMCLPGVTNIPAGSGVIDVTACKACAFGGVYQSYSFSASGCAWHNGGPGVGQPSWVCASACGQVNQGEGYLLICYYPDAVCTTCEEKSLYGTRDATGALTILDAGGVLNWLAVAYG